MTQVMTEINIDQIVPNPYRDFSLYPIDAEQVDALAEGYAVRDFGIIAVRPAHYDEPGIYEQVYGHHRIAAMKQLGMVKARVLVEDIDDDQLIAEMTEENTKQQGNNVAAQVDSVAAIVSRLAYLMLISTNLETLCGITQRVLFDSEQGYLTAKKMMLSGAGLGRDLVMQYMPGLRRNEVAGALAVLKDTGKIGEILDRVRQEVDHELAEQVKAEAAARKEAEANRKEAARLERDAKKAAKVAADAAEVAGAARKVEAKAKAKEAAKREAVLRDLREEAAQEERERQQAESEAKLKREQADADARQAQQEFSEKARGLNPDVVAMLKTEGHLDMFRKWAISSPKTFPRDGQPALVVTMRKHAEDSKVKFTAAFIGQMMAYYVNENDAMSRKLAEDRRKRLEAESKERQAEGIANRLHSALIQLHKSMRELDGAGKDKDLASWIINKIDLKTTATYLDGIEFMVPKVRAGLRLKKRARYDQKAADAVVSNQ